MVKLHVVVLAAGKGTRMKSARPKVLHLLAGRSVLDHVLGAVAPLGGETTTLVIGHGGEEVKAALTSRAPLQFVSQSPQLGTGHALMQAEPLLRGKTGNVLLLHANVPLISTATLHRLVERHRSTRAAMTLLTSTVEDSYGHERVVRDGQGQVTRVIEEGEVSGEEQSIREVSSGIYCFELAPLLEMLHALAADASQGEYYLTDLVPLCRRLSLKVETLQLDSAAELRGVTTRVDVADLTATALASVVLENSAAQFLPGGFTVVAQEVGLRMTSPDKHPVVGRSPGDPRLGIFNGLGSKGALLAPGLARQWVNHLTEAVPFDPAVDVRRFAKRAG